MANYYTQAAFELTLTLEQKTFALQVLECAQDELVDLSKPQKNRHGRAYPNDVYRVAKKFVKCLDEYETGNVNLPFIYTDTGNSIYFSHDENIIAIYCNLSS